MDVRGGLGLSDEVRNGFERIRVTFRSRATRPPRSCARSSSARTARSAVFDMVAHGVPVASTVGSRRGAGDRRRA